jgi:PIN domain nuclease of toxin-antitoxin system
MSSGAVVLDASAVLAFLFGEQGGEKVLAVLGGSIIPAINWAEVVQRAMAFGIECDEVRSEFEGTGARIVPVEAAHAEQAARLREPTRSAGLSLADRVCFAVAAERRSAVMTADRAWENVDIGVEVRLIR